MKILSSSWSLGRLRGVDIRLHSSVLFVIPIAYAIFRPRDLRGAVGMVTLILGFFLCILLHEIGHAVTAQVLGVEVSSIIIWMLGGVTNLGRTPERPILALVITSAGSLVNMLLAFIFVLLYIIASAMFLPYDHNFDLFLWGQTLNELLLSLAFLNLILAVFNLLPVYPLDGGKMLRSLMEIFFGRSNADMITMIVSIPILLGLAAFGISTRDYLLLASCVLFILAVATLNRSTLRWLNLGVNFIFKRGGYYFLKGDFERAAQFYAREIDREPGRADHYLARAACRLNMQQKERALADVERVLKIAPCNAIALQLRGEIHAVEKDYEAALEFFGKAQQVNPNWAIPYFGRASVLMDKKEYQPALEQYDKAASLHPQLPLFFIARSMAHYRLENLEAAHEDQDIALALSHEQALVMVDVNMTMYEGYLDWAEDFYTRVMSKYPRSWHALQGRADAYRVNGEHAQAIADYTRALEIDPREPRSYFGRGKSRQAVGDLEGAAEDLHQVSRLTDRLHLKRQAEQLLKSLEGA